MSKPFKVFLFVIGIPFTFAMLDSCGILGFTYPRTIDNNPLTDPVDIVVITNQVLTLANGQSFAVSDDFRWEDKLYDRQIELQSLPDGRTRLFVKRRHLFCDTPWARLVTIRLVPVDIKKWTRSEIGTGTEIRKSDQLEAEPVRK